MAERPMRQVAVSFRLDEETKRLLGLLAEQSGQSKTSVIVALIREKAQREKREA
jgi:predicted transcriptional regulator